jgi:lipid-A-disaccharide synthase
VLPSIENDTSCAKPPRIFISAAEPSGDQHAAELIRVLRRRIPAADVFGVAGPKMQTAGCRAIDDLTARSAMLVGAAGMAAHAWLLIRRIRRMLTDGPADLAILVDSPALHLPMAKAIKATGCPVLYYIAPQLWAWAPWRIRRVRSRVDQLAVILPFEERYFRDRGVPTRFVGHPLIEQLESNVAVAPRGGAPDFTIACLPGSRRHVVEEVLPGQIEVARKIAAVHPTALFLFSAASEQTAGLIRPQLDRAGLNARLEINANAAILSAADLALCASGTATLEVAWHRVPMIIMYNGSNWGYRLVGRWLIRTPHLALPNILAGRRIVPEFMPYYTSTDPIAAEALDLLASDARRAQMRSDIDAVIRSLGTTNAAENTADIALQMIGKPVEIA